MVIVGVLMIVAGAPQFMASFRPPGQWFRATAVTRNGQPLPWLVRFRPWQLRIGGTVLAFMGLMVIIGN
jgi:hypothetical protein